MPTTRAPTNRRGNNAIEFALVLPILVALLTGISDLGVYFSARMSVTSAARDAARAASLTPIGDPVTPVGVAQGQASLTAAGLNGQTTCEVIGFSPDQAVRCFVTVGFDPLFGLVPVPATLESTVTMRMEEQP